MSAATRVASWTELPLGPGGRCVIEASAGTGKTWTIAALYLRLLLEQGLTPRQIVVTTFTEAAAQELRERLRERLRRAERDAAAFARGAFEPRAGARDEQWLHARWSAGTRQAEHDRLRLRLAQMELDQAPVGTLHGLCRRILADFPFECGSAFRLGEVVSARALEDELLKDLWRELSQSSGELPPGDLAWWRGGYPALATTLRRAIKPGVRVARIGSDTIDALLQPQRAAAIRTWVGDGSQFKTSRSVLPRALLELAGFIEAGDRAANLPRKTAEDLLKPLETQLKPAALEAAQGSELLAFVRQAAHGLRQADAPARSEALARYVERLTSQRDERLRARGQLTFDELVGQVHRALAEGGGALADRLFREWPVALVDEFQDTDVQQYAILDRIYRDGHAAARGRLVMIGDPKQAIYRFRGGDIHAYQRAAASADARLQLEVNFRSSQALLDGLNELYRRAGPQLSQHPDAAIAYTPVQAGKNKPALTVDGCVVTQPLALHWLGELPDNKDARIALALHACADHITVLLDGRHAIGAEPLQPGDIAVLLPTNDQVATLRQLLGERNVPCVGAARSSVFAGDMARELQIVLYAVEHTGDEGALRAALATRLYGLGYAALRRLRDEPDAWQSHQQRFAHWHQLWARGGVLAVVQALLQHAAPALLAGKEAERALTDLRHLGELLQTAEEKLQGPEQVLAWLAEQRTDQGDGAGDAAEEQQLRIESDARRVRLLTLHASKGLEFPVVLLPLMWTQEGRDETLPLHYDPASSERVLVLGGPDHADACAEAAREDQDERFRVLYVALTRAELACHVYVANPGRRRNGQDSQPATDPCRSALDATVLRLQAEGGREFSHLQWVADDWVWPRKNYRVQTTGEPSRVALPMPVVRPMQQVYSFSTLTRADVLAPLEDQPASDEDRAGSPEADDADTALAAPVVPFVHPALQALAPWRGAEFGNALHAMFEHREIGMPMAQQPGLIRRELLAAGVGRADEAAELARRLASRLQATLDAELAPGLRLGALPASALRAEMAFHYVLDAVSMQQLRRACARHGEPELVPHAPASVLRGLMTGKIDLLFEHDGRFHVLDYKSNYLGDDLDAYTPGRLVDAMDAHHYRFQALLYTVALDRMLRQRLPGYRRGEQLGEAVYLFVRAVGLAPQAGVWRQRFDDALLDAVDEALGAARSEALA